MSDGRVYGRHPVLELLRSSGRRADEVAVLAGGRGPLAEVVALARRAGVKVSFRTREQLTAMAGSQDHQGVVARVTAAEYVDVEDLLEIPRARSEPAFVMALDQVQDPRNLGALLRTADAFGAHGVVIPERRAAGITAAAWKTSAGAAARVPVAQTVNLVRQLKAYQQAGCMVVGLAADGEVSLPDLDLADGPLVVVVGSEGKGLSRLVAETCDLLVSVPMAGRLESLNAGVAAGVVLYAVARART